jgi:hypothetical protein
LECSITGKTFRGGAFHRKLFTHTYEDIISVENLFLAWREFVKGKRHKKDVQEFQYSLMDSILALHCDLKVRTYRHSTYEAFKVNGPKPHDIHKATVRDRLLHHALYRKPYPFFDATFIHDSYSSRRGRGTHKAIQRFKHYAYKVSKNHTRTCFASDAAIYLNFSTRGALDFSGLLLGGILIGVLGVLDDVAITQASVTIELVRANTALRWVDLYRRALRVGQDHIGSLVNTLALAYTGVSLPLLMLFARTDSGFLDIVNQEVVASEIVRTLVGSFGLMLTVPATTLIAVWYVRRFGVPEEQGHEGHAHHHEHSHPHSHHLS